MASKTQKKAKKKGQAGENPVFSEAVLLFVLLISLLLFISCFQVGGSLGKIVSSALFGIFGLLAYLFPVFLFLSAAFLISNKSNPIARIKVAAVAGLVLFLCTFAQLVSTNFDETRSFGDYYAMAANARGYGGFLGGLMTRLLCPAIGTVGAYVADLLMIAISFVLITEKSILKGLGAGGKKVYNRAKQDAQKRREQPRRQRDTAPRKTTGPGVTLDTKIEAPPDQTPVGMRELGSDNRARGESLPVQEKEPESSLELAGEYIEPMTALHIEGGYSPNQEQDQPPQEEGDPVDMAENDLQGGGAETPESPEPEDFEVRGMVRLESGAQDKAVDIGEEKVSQTGTHGDMVSRESARQEEAGNAGEETASHAGKPGGMVRLEHAGQEETGSVGESNIPQARAQEETGDAGKESTFQGAGTAVAPQPVQREYVFPSIDLLKKNTATQARNTDQQLRETAIKLQQTLESFGVKVNISNVSCGPAVTRYEMQPDVGVKVSKILSLADDIKLNLAASDIRIEAPIPGKAAVGIEVPNKHTVPVMLRELIESPEFQDHPSKLAFAAGKDISGQVVVADIARMPHLLIAGSTGSGKSVCINTLIMSILYKASPEEVKLIMVDPKVVELSVYNGIPHLLIPVVTDPKKAAGALNWAVAEMSDRYQKFADYNVRDLKGYNEKVQSVEDLPGEGKPEKLPQIVIIVDELADLMMVAPGEVEDSICRLAQLARAAGIHLIIATQRPSVNVITGLIKANMPSRVAFAVSSGVDSRTIIDMNGAEKLLGKGDMLFYPQGYQKPLRVQGAFVSDGEVSAVTAMLTEQTQAASPYSQEMEEQLGAMQSAAGGSGDWDEHFVEAARLVIDKDKASIGMLQRMFRIGFNRAARLMEQLADAGVVGEEDGTKPRKVLMSPEELEQFVEEYL